MNPSYAFLRHRGMLLFTGLTLGVAILVTVRHHRQVNEYLAGVQHAHEALQAGEQFLSALTAAENGHNRYLLTGKEADLAPFREGKALADLKLATLRELTRGDARQQERLNQVAAAAGRQIQEMEGLLSLAAAHGPDSARQVMGGEVRKSGMTLLRADMDAFATAEQDRLRAGDAQFAAARFTARLLQAGVLGLILCALYYLFRSLHRQQAGRKALFRQIDEQNRTLIMDVSPDRRGADAPVDEKAVVEGLITNLRSATAFIVQIGQGNYDVDFGGITRENLEPNRHNLSGSLMQMREQLRSVAGEDRRRNWTTEGLARFADLLRLHGAGQEGLGDKIISFLVKYLGANQGGLFLIEQEKEPAEIELIACFAYDRKKHLHKTFPLGEGLVGQAVQEAETIYITEVPAGYVQITSGLGEAPPRAILIVPLKRNDAVLGALELAFFQPLEPYRIAFTEKVAENMASAIAGARMQERTQRLLTLSQQQTEEMRAAEEEMRQNMEEIEATQEEMRRKSEAMESLLAQAQDRELLMQAQEKIMQENMAKLHASEAAIKRATTELNAQALAIDTALATVEFALDGTILKANDNFLRMVGYTHDEVMGQHHRIFLTGAQGGSEAYAQFWDALREGATQTGDFSRVSKAGKTIWLKASYTPARDENGRLYKVIKFAHDITAQKQLEADVTRRMQLIETMNAEMETQNNIINSVAIVSKTDLQGNITYVNEAFLHWSKYTREEVIGRNHRILKSGDQPDELFRDLWNTISSGRTFRGEIKNKAKDGTFYWVDAIIAPVLGEDGKPKEYIGQRFVINEAKEKEARLREALQQMQAQEQVMREAIAQLNTQKE